MTTKNVELFYTKKYVEKLTQTTLLVDQQLWHVQTRSEKPLWLHQPSPLCQRQQQPEEIFSNIYFKVGTESFLIQFSSLLAGRYSLQNQSIAMQVHAAGIEDRPMMWGRSFIFIYIIIP